MPRFCFFCLDCKKEYCVFTSSSERDKKSLCKFCNGENTKRQISNFSIKQENLQEKAVMDKIIKINKDKIREFSEKAKTLDLEGVKSNG